ncbi:MAG: EAL domain-containing protein [Devosia sp.]|nr:EAL domain-containing protein [Devosia sp.]
MRSKYSNPIIVLAAILAFAPIAVGDLLLDHYVREHESARLQQDTDQLTARIEDAANSAVGSLRRILADSPSLCTPTFMSNVRDEMQSSLYLRQVLVENAEGLQYCDAFGKQVSYLPLSDSLSIPGHTETASVVKVDGLDVPLLKVTQTFGDQRRVSTFVPILPNALHGFLDSLAPATFARLALANGAAIVTAGDAAAFDHRKADADFVSAQSFAGEIPIRAEVAAPFSVVRANYAELDISLTLITCATSAAFLIMMLQYVRRSSLPSLDLEHAIAHGELKAYYQPVINLKTGRLIGCEMLCRWEKKNGEIVPPGVFIDYAEQTGLAIPMTLSLMQQIRSDLAELCDDMPDLKIGINLFEGHFRDSSIVEDVQAIFGGSPIGFRQLMFEITERRPLGNSAQAASVIAGLHALGAKLAMDDAGTGHSNLAYLQTLGVDVIKIDRIFVDMVKPGTTQVPVLDGLIAVARDLGTDVIAEGVETEVQALYLRAHGVVQAQGFLFSPALKPKSFKQLARALNGKPARLATALSDAA